MGCAPSSVLRCMQRRGGKLETNDSIERSEKCEKAEKTARNSRDEESTSKENVSKTGLDGDEFGIDGLENRNRNVPYITDNEDGDICVINGPQDLKPNLLTTWSPGSIKIMLAFPREDHQTEVLGAAAKRLGWYVSHVRTSDAALENLQNRGHDIVIIDHRSSRGFDADSLCRSIRAASNNFNCVIVALVRKSFLVNAGKDEVATLGLLDIGYNRTLLECSQETLLANDLANIYASEVQPRLQLAAFHALHLAVDRCRDMIHVTNERHVVQVVNKASERLLGFKGEEMLGKKIVDFITSENFLLMEQQLQRGREWEGNMNCKRKMSKPITINCRIVPFSASGRKPTHYIYVHDTTYLLENMGVGPGGAVPQQHPRGSLHSLRRGSLDLKSVGSETQRRASFAKLCNLPLDAPITRVIYLLTNAATETAVNNPELAAQIDKAIDLLKSTELYAPQIREDSRSYHDPVTNDLLGALLSSPLYARDSRRSSNDSTTRVPPATKLLGSSGRRHSILNYRPPQEIYEMMETSLAWEFDIFKLEVLSNGRPLVFLGMNLMSHYQGASTLNCDEKTMYNWLNIVESHYHPENSYHNSAHAADVMQATARFMRSERLKMILDPLDEVTALIAAAAHDIDHPGRSSQFLCNADNKLAILYNDLSVLESHHAALTFKLTLSDDRANVFKNLDREVYKVVRQNVIDMILATEMTKHFEHLAKFVNFCSSRMATGDSQSGSASDTMDLTVLLQTDNVTLVKRMMIKCADVSNPTRPLKACLEWTRRIAEEYFSQTDEEKKNGLPVMMPMFDRMTCSIPNSQIGFVDYIINDMLEAWDAFIDMPEIINYMRHNYEKWKEYQEQGISTLQDIEKLQTMPELQIPRLPQS